MRTFTRSKTHSPFRHARIARSAPPDVDTEGLVDEVGATVTMVLEQTDQIVRVFSEPKSRGAFFDQLEESAALISEFGVLATKPIDFSPESRRLVDDLAQQARWTLGLDDVLVERE